MEKYLVTRILDKNSYFFVNTEIFGDVEIRSSDNDLPIEIEFFKKLTVPILGKKIDFEDYKFSNRVSVIVDANNPEDAVNIADEKIIPVLDLKSQFLSFSNIALSKLTIVRNLKTGYITPYINTDGIKSGCFITRNTDIQKYNIINYVIDNKDNNDNLVSRYSRSLHWSHLANDENNKQLKILFNYFCLENLFSRDERDHIDGIVKCFIGFPVKKKQKHISKEILSKLTSSNTYNLVFNNMNGLFESIREFRNKTVHNGFRYFDIEDNKLNLYNEILHLSKFKCLEAVQHALLVKNINTLEELNNEMWDIFNEISDTNYIINTFSFSISKYFIKAPN
ncbi:hypothetical protein [Proteus vulgaris]|uniref:hypothetical protein n=1 Tax=Proteus vulgaris TaxID=585 RepID=UPI000657BD2B|nr:hypothetical protein [Proteus vulgaris]CRL60051.1 hypothetical protein BN1805_00526 [Proteus vulgaris]